MQLYSPLLSDLQNVFLTQGLQKEYLLLLTIWGDLPPRQFILLFKQFNKLRIALVRGIHLFQIICMIKFICTNVLLDLCVLHKLIASGMGSLDTGDSPVNRILFTFHFQWLKKFFIDSIHIETKTIYACCCFSSQFTLNLNTSSGESYSNKKK